MVKKNEVMPVMGKKINLIWLGVLFSVIYWFFESLRDTYIYHKAPLLNSLVFPDSTSLSIRLFVVGMIILFTIHSLYLINRMKEQVEGEPKYLGVVGIVLSLVVFGALYWILDSFQDVLIEVKGDMLKYILSPGSMMLWTRILAIVFIAIFVYSVYSLAFRLRSAERKLQIARNQLKKSRENLNSIIQNDSDGIVIIDKGGMVRFMNPSAEEIFDCNADQLIGKPFGYSLKKDQSAEIIIKHLSGRQVTAEMCVVELEWEDKEAYLASLRDISARKEIEGMKNDFISLLTYQLKSPVVGVMGCIDNMLEGLTGDLKKEQKEYLELMHEVVTRDYRIISDLLNVTRIESGGLSINIHKENLSNLIEAGINPYRKMIQQKNLKLIVEEESRDIIVAADRNKIIEAICNVVHNAVKFTDKGSITVRTKTKKDIALIEISDSGKGIAKSEQKDLFKKNQMLSGEPKPEQGLGLGLYIAKIYLKLQKGDISVESEAGKGSTFILQVPLV